MAVKLNKRAYKHAKELIQVGHVVFDERDAWSEHRPSAEKENEYIQLHGFREYGKWYLGVDNTENEEIKGRYKFPYGDSIMSTVAECFRPKAGPDNTSTTTSKMRQPTCMG